jgi:hypothetical protein
LPADRVVGGLFLAPHFVPLRREVNPEIEGNRLMRFHPLADIFPLVEGVEFDALYADIKVNGQREPIWLIEEGGEHLILDGRNRYRACLRAGVEPLTRLYRGTDPLGLVVSLNLQRRQLTAGQRATVALKIEAVESERAALRRKATQAKPGQQVGQVVADLRPPSEPVGKASELAAASVGASPRNVQKAKAVAKARPDLLQKVESGSLSLNAAERQMKEDKAAEDLARPAVIALPEGIHHGDFRELSVQIEDNSIALVFTDPPYDADSVGLYEDAARISARILKPGGSVIAYSGQKYLPQVLAGMSKHLRYWWTIAGVHDGGNQMLEKLGVRCGWKPLVWFVKETRGDVQNVLLDVVRGDREKDAHQWQQAEAEALHIIEKLCPPGGTVVDFCLGGGTTAAACKKLGRKFIGFEINAASLERSVERLAA